MSFPKDKTQTRTNKHTNTHKTQKQKQKDGDNDNDETPKPRRLSEVPVSKVLKAKHTLRWVEPIIDGNSTVRNAIEVRIERGLSAMMVVDTGYGSSSE